MRRDNPLSDLALEELGYQTLAISEEKIIKPLKYFTQEGKNTARDPNNSSFIQNDYQEEENLQPLELDDLLQPPEPANRNMLPGLDFLLNNVIGEEDDEKVIDFIKSSKTASGENT
jgi:hypothetical protein